MLAAVTVSSRANANVLYFAMPVNYDQQETDTVFVYGAPGTTGTISSPNGFSSGFSVGASSVASVVVPSTYDLTTSGAVTNNGFVVATTDPNANVGASYLSREPYTTDTTYLLNSTALGTSYYAVGATNSIGYPSQLTIVGTQANTTVTITPSTNLPGHPAGTPFNVTVGAGQSVMFTDTGTPGQDITGTKITSSAPIAVFGGNQCVDVPATSSACDHTITALPSTNEYTTHVVVPTTTGTEGTSSNILRVLAATNGTVVTYNGAVVATLNAGQYADIRTGPSGGDLTSNNPILAVEYLTGQSEHPGTPGDPAESYVPGVSQWLNSYVFSTPVGSQAYTDNFLDLSVPLSDLTSLMLDGSAVPTSDCTAVPGSSGYFTCEIAIAAGSGTISATDPFLLMIDGGTSYDSYFTFAGTTFSAGASPPPPLPAVPEPASIMLLGVGLAGLFARRRRAA